MECSNKYNTFSNEELEFLCNMVSDYIFEYVYELTSDKHKQLLLSIMRKLGADEDGYFTKLLGGKNNG